MKKCGTSTFHPSALHANCNHRTFSLFTFPFSFRKRLVVLLLAAASASVWADPYVGFTYPAGIQAGTKVRVLVGGQGFWGKIHAWVSGEGVRVVDIERVPAFTRAPGDGQRQWLGKWLRNLEDGVKAMPELPKDEVLRNWPRNRWWESLDTLDPLALSIVRRDHYEPRPDPLQAAPAIAERLILTVVADPSAAPGLRHLVLYDNKGASAPQPFFVSTEPHVAEPLYVAPPPKGRKPLAREPSVCETPVVLDGQVLPGETDVFCLALTGGTRLTCLLIGRELSPYLGDTVPGFFNPVLRLTDADGNELAFADDFGFLPDPVLTCDIRRTGTYRLEVRDNLYRGRDDFVYEVSCYSDDRPLPTLRERAFLCNGMTKTRGERKDAIPNRGAHVSFDFEVKEPGRMDFELFARRQGSLLDGVLRLYGPVTGWWFLKDAPLLATWDDVTNRLHVGSVPQAECDPQGCWEFTEPGNYRIAVEDRSGGGGDGYDFTLDLRPSEPDFEVYALKSTLVVRPQKDSKVAFKVKVVRRGGFVGAIKVLGNDDFAVAKGTIPSGEAVAEVVVVPTRRDWSGVRRTSFRAVAEGPAGKSLEHPVVPGHEVEQAFAYTHILPAVEFLVFMQPMPEGLDLPPEWIEMPYDAFLPRRVISSSVDFSTFKTDFCAGLDALADVDVTLMKLPGDAGDGVLAAKFAASAACFRKRNRGVFAFESATARDEAAARAVLAGCVGLVKPKTLDYAEGDAQRVRTMARAMALPPDNDILFYVPGRSGNPLSGSVGAAARRLRDNGWCYDFVTDKTLTNAPFGRVHRTLFVPVDRKSLSEGARQFLDEKVPKRGCKVVYAELQAKNENRKLAERARREELPKGLRFARFGRTGGEGWYFVYNPTAAPISGEVRFRIRGWARSAVRMDVRTGEISWLGKASSGKFSLSLDSGASVWIRVTAAEPSSGL